MIFTNEPSYNPLGLRFQGMQFQVANANPTQNSNNTVDADPDQAVGVWWAKNSEAWQPASSGGSNPITGIYTEATDGGYLWRREERWRKFQSDEKKFDWIQQLLVPGVQAAANLLLLEYQQSKYEEQADEAQDIIMDSLQEYCDCIEANLPDFEAFHPRIPKAAKYVPVDFCEEQERTICCNINNVIKSQEFIKAMDQVHLKQQSLRMQSFDSNFICKATEYNGGIERLLKGIIDQETMIEVLTDDAEQSAMYGRIGSVCRANRTSLGITKLRMQELGRDRFERAADLWQRVSPVEKLGDMRSMMLTPQQRIGWALTISQLVQNSLQNEYNIEAAGDPAKMAELQVKLNKCLQTLLVSQGKANAVNQNVPNYAAILQPQINTISNGIGSGINSFINNRANQPIQQNIPTAPAVQQVYNTDKLPPSGSIPGDPAYDAWSYGGVGF